MRYKIKEDTTIRRNTGGYAKAVAPILLFKEVVGEGRTEADVAARDASIDLIDKYIACC